MLGHGYTGKPSRPYEIADYVAHLLDYLDAVGVRRAHIVGESLGGWVGARAAIDQPERILSLQLLCAGGTVANPAVMERIRTSTKNAVASDDLELTRKRLRLLMADDANATEELVQIRHAIYHQPDFVANVDNLLSLQDLETPAAQPAATRRPGPHHRADAGRVGPPEPVRRGSRGVGDARGHPRLPARAVRELRALAPARTGRPLQPAQPRLPAQSRRLMRAARFHQWGAAPVAEDVAEPTRAAGEVLVQVQAGAVAHLDVTVAGGDFGLKPSLPYIGGVEGAGVVLEAEALAQIAPGAQVILRGGGLGVLRDGTWAERVSVPLKSVTVLASPLPPEVAATFFVPATTAYVALHDVARVRPGEHVIVVGAAGAVGSMAAQQALAAGARVTGVVGRADQLADVPRGVDAVDLTSADAVASLAAERPAALLIDTLGGDGLIARTRWVRPGGRAVVIGYVTGPRTEIDLPSWLLDDVALLPVNMIRPKPGPRGRTGAGRGCWWRARFTSMSSATPSRRPAA